MFDTKGMMALQSFVEENLAPAVGGHGGSIEIIHYDGKTVEIHLGGACAVCAFDTQTKDWVADEIKKKFPSIESCLVKVVRSEPSFQLS